MFFSLVHLDIEDTNFIVNTVQKDTEFLASKNIILYSLRFCVERLNTNDDDGINMSALSMSRPSDNEVQKRNRFKSSDRMFSRHNRRLSEFYKGGSVYSSEHQLVKEEDFGSYSNLTELEQVYHIGIINFLNSWSFTRKVNSKLRQVKEHNCRSTDHAVHPDCYRKRLLNFIEKTLFQFSRMANDTEFFD